MLKSLKDIPYPKLRQLARKRIKEYKLNIPIWNSPLKFDWMGTPEGLEFWHLIQRGNYHKARSQYPHLFIALPRSKKQELAWNCGSVLGSLAMATVNLQRVSAQNNKILTKLLDRRVGPDLSVISANLAYTDKELKEILHRLQVYSGRLHALAKEVLTNDNKE